MFFKVQRQCVFHRLDKQSSVIIHSIASVLKGHFIVTYFLNEMYIVSCFIRQIKTTLRKFLLNKYRVLNLFFNS